MQNSYPKMKNNEILYQELRGDSIKSITKNGTRFLYTFSMRYHTSDNNLITTLQGKVQKGNNKEHIHSGIIKTMNEIFKQYNIEEIYCFKRKEIEILILKKLRSRFKKEQITVNAILLRSIDFSEKLKQQIYEKLLKEEEEKKQK
ncbi:MAG: SPFH domain-containing protein [Nitrososphaeraceae archaeon]|jgi:regulator of protease activity HflC (stomatin/prohibitin superfamily)